MEAAYRFAAKAFVKKNALLIAAAIPFLLSLVFHSIGPVAQHAALAADRPALAFEQYLVNLREVPPLPAVYASFAFTNTGNRPVTIKTLEPSCSCLAPKLAKKIYQPGERGEFYLHVRTAYESAGPKEYFCNVRYEDGKPRETMLTFKVVLPEKMLNVYPRRLGFYQFNSSEPTTKEIEVTNNRRRRLKLTGVECSSDLVRVAIAEPEIDELGIRRHKVSVTVSEVPPGRHQAAVKIHTDDPMYPELTVPLFLFGSNQPEQQIGGKPNAFDRKRR